MGLITPLWDLRAGAGSVSLAEAAGPPESFHGLFKTELIRRRGPWKDLDDVELATLERLDWFNHRRLHTALGLLPPAEYEAQRYAQQPALSGASP